MVDGDDGAARAACEKLLASTNALLETVERLAQNESMMAAARKRSRKQAPAAPAASKSKKVKGGTKMASESSAERRLPPVELVVHKLPASVTQEQLQSVLPDGITVVSAVHGKGSCAVQIAGCSPSQALEFGSLCVDGVAYFVSLDHKKAPSRSCEIVLKHCPESLTAEHIHKHFATFRIQRVVFRAKWTCFVRFHSPAAAAAALKSSRVFEVDGRRIRASKLEDKPVEKTRQNKAQAEKKRIDKVEKKEEEGKPSE
eukprot:NODE_3736_length_926_cov_26.592930_g3435_i0.p1 GENE.NODE_3736_length_926_cov_26.592930_g3435_i0~~NODE_3736_length_926_cov_26.592930_g3435_i0.p1  ORF type:complete len:257 (+),score=63.04 NODE_3736_length_926_cov_26.592930_g3435_i0:82-852(+)